MLQSTKTQARNIRVIVLGLIRNADRLFVSEGYDAVKQTTYYRALGGAIEFGETSLAALQREFQEELNADLTNIQYLGCLENLFSYNGEPGHEIVQLYRCDFADPRFYQLQQVTYRDSNTQFTADWIEIRRFQTGELRLVPEACLDYI